MDMNDFAGTLLLGSPITVGDKHYVVTRSWPANPLDGNRKQRRAKMAKLRETGKI